MKITHRRARLAVGSAVAAGLVVLPAFSAQAAPPGPADRASHAAAPQRSAGNAKEAAASGSRDIPNLNALVAKIATHRDETKATRHDTFVPAVDTVQGSGVQHIRFNRYHRGLPVLGGEVIVHTDARGRYDHATTPLGAPLDLRVTPRVERQRAASRARDAVGDRPVEKSARLAVDASRAHSGKPAVLAWEVRLKDRHAPDLGTVHQLMNAETGKPGPRWCDNPHAGAGRGVREGSVPLTLAFANGSYELLDPTRGGTRTLDLLGTTEDHPQSPGVPIMNSTGVFGDFTTADRNSIAADAQYSAANAYDYFTEAFGRNGVRDDGSGSVINVHHGASATAYWDRANEWAVFGDGGPGTPLVASDVVGHELGHGIVHKTGNMYLSLEAGALNESTGDIFGTMAEFHAGNLYNLGDYEPGELSGPQGHRYMDDPAKDGQSLNCWSPDAQLADSHHCPPPVG